MKRMSLLSTLTIIALTSCNLTKKNTPNMTGQETFEISYAFQTGAKNAFEMWTNPEHFSSWLGPDGAEMAFIKANVVEGRTSLWTMTTPDGLTKFGQINFKTITPNTLLIYTQNFCDKDGHFIKAPFSATYPDSLLTTVSFSEKDDVTSVKVIWEISGHAAEEEKQTFVSMKELMKTGWTASFEKLNAMLKRD